MAVSKKKNSPIKFEFKGWMKALFIALVIIAFVFILAKVWSGFLNVLLWGYNQIRALFNYPPVESGDVEIGVSNIAGAAIGGVIVLVGVKLMMAGAASAAFVPPVGFALLVVGAILTVSSLWTWLDFTGWKDQEIKKG